MKILYCEGCKIKVAEIKIGSKIKKGTVVLCKNCETKRIASDLASKNKTNTTLNPLKDIFGY